MYTVQKLNYMYIWCGLLRWCSNIVDKRLFIWTDNVTSDESSATDDAADTRVRKPAEGLAKRTDAG